MNDIKHDEKGLTLVEIMVVILIMSIVSLLIFRFIDFGVSSFTYGVEQAENQSNLRLTAYKITNEVRNARAVNLLDAPGTVSLDEHIYLDGDTLKHNDAASSVSRMSDDLLTNIQFSTTMSNDKVLLNIIISGQDGESLDTEVLLNNMTSITNTSGTVIEFDFNIPASP